MIGLKTYLPTLAPLLSLSVDVLYERQRYLTDVGVLESTGGRGPGSGVRADEKTLASFLISLMSHDIQAHTYVAEFFCVMKHIDGKCRVTGGKTFQESLQRVLGDESIAKRTFAVRLKREHPSHAQIVFGGKNNKPVISAFEHKGLILPRMVRPSAITTLTSIGPEFIQQIAKDIAQFKKDGAS
jgi:hypothetical protein